VRIAENNVMSQPSLVCGGTIAAVVWLLGVATPAASGQTPLPWGLEIRLLPDYTHEQLRGEHGPTGKFTKKGGLEVHYFMGRIGRPDEAPTSGDFHSAAVRVPEPDRLWLKEQNVAGRHVHVAYTKDRRLMVSSASTKEGVNFTAVAESPGDVADVLLMVLSLAEPQARDK